MVDGRWPLRAISGNQVIGAARSTHRLHRPNGDHVGIVSGRGDGPVPIGSGRIVPAIIASGYHHHDAGLISGFHGLTERVEGVAFEYRTAQREIDYADLVLGFQSDSRLNGADYLAVGARPVLVEYAQVDEIYVRGDAVERVEVLRPGRFGAVPANDS